MPLFAMSFATWVCAVPGCDTHVEFEDALWIDDERVIACIHREHVDG